MTDVYWEVLSVDLRGGSSNRVERSHVQLHNVDHRFGPSDREESLIDGSLQSESECKDLCLRDGKDCDEPL